MQGLLTTAEAAQRLRVTEKSVRRYCEQGKLRHHRTATGHIRIPSDAIDEFLGEVVPVTDGAA